MIGPRKKISKTKRKTRHAMWQRLMLKKMSNKYAVSTCANCGANKLSHRVCSVCGYYKGKQVITIKTKKENVVDA